VAESQNLQAGRGAQPTTQATPGALARGRRPPARPACRPSGLTHVL